MTLNSEPNPDTQRYLTPSQKLIRTNRLGKLAIALGLSLTLLACSDDNDDPIFEPDPDDNGPGDFIPPEPPSGYTVKEISFAENDMVAAANPVAVQAGVDIWPMAAMRWMPQLPCRRY